MSAHTKRAEMLNSTSSFYYVYDLIVQLKRGSFWNVTMWSIWSIHHQIWTDFATVDEIWNSVEKSEFAPIGKIDISRFLLLSSDLFESGSEMGRNTFSNFEQFRDLTLCESGSPWCGGELPGQRLSIEPELAVIHRRQRRWTQTRPANTHLLHILETPPPATKPKFTHSIFCQSQGPNFQFDFLLRAFGNL